MQRRGSNIFLNISAPLTLLFALLCDIQLEMVLQVSPDPWQVMMWLDSHLPQLVSVPHPGELQQLRAVHCPARQYHLLCPHLPHHSTAEHSSLAMYLGAVPELHAHRPPALQQHLYIM